MSVPYSRGMDSNREDSLRAGAQVTDLSIARFRKHVTAIAGIYYRLDRGISGGRNSASTDATLEWHVRAAQDLINTDARRTDANPLCDYLDQNTRLATKWNTLERRFYGLR